MTDVKGLIALVLVVGPIKRIGTSLYFSRVGCRVLLCSKFYPSVAKWSSLLCNCENLFQKKIIVAAYIAASSTLKTRAKTKIINLFMSVIYKGS